MSRSVSSREVRLRDHVDWRSLCPVKCGEVTVKKKRVETFRNIRYGDGRIYYIYIIIIYTDSAAAVSPPVGLAQARPNYY